MTADKNTRGQAPPQPVPLLPPVTVSQVYTYGSRFALCFAARALVGPLDVIPLLPFPVRSPPPPPPPPPPRCLAEQEAC